jgi:6-pyruvoyltetrahydropterin/6-carboxytetrahydropterin synthase
VKASLTSQYQFSASHRLHVPFFDDEENARLYGKCNNPFGHGHNYILSVTATGPIHRQTGLIVRRQELDALVCEQVLPLFRHKYLNVDLPQFAQLVPTTENVCLVIADLLNEHWRSYIPDPAVRLSRVHVQETERNSFEILVPVSRESIQEKIHENVVVHA